MHKYIIHIGRRGAREAYDAVIISTDRDRSLATYNALVNEAVETFPTLRPKDLRCLAVLQSHTVKGHAAVKFSVPGDPDNPEGWKYVTARSFEPILG